MAGRLGTIVLVGILIASSVLVQASAGEKIGNIYILSDIDQGTVDIRYYSISHPSKSLKTRVLISRSDIRMDR